VIPSRSRKALKLRLFFVLGFGGDEDMLAQQEQRPAKQARTSGAAVEPQPSASTSTSAVPSAAATKAEEKKRKAQVKKVFDRCITAQLRFFFFPFDVLIHDACAVRLDSRSSVNRTTSSSRVPRRRSSSMKCTLWKSLMPCLTGRGR